MCLLLGVAQIHLFFFFPFLLGGILGASWSSSESCGLGESSFIAGAEPEGVQGTSGVSSLSSVWRIRLSLDTGVSLPSWMIPGGVLARPAGLGGLGRISVLGWTGAAGSLTLGTKDGPLGGGPWQAGNGSKGRTELLSAVLAGAS